MRRFCHLCHFQHIMCRQLSQCNLQQKLLKNKIHRRGPIGQDQTHRINRYWTNRYSLIGPIEKGEEPTRSSPKVKGIPFYSVSLLIFRKFTLSITKRSIFNSYNL